VTRERLDGIDDSRVRVYNDLRPNDTRLVELYSRADIFVLPTRADCYSLAGIEALASGLPVILGRTGGTGDVIRDGKTGYLIEPDNPTALSMPLDALIHDAALRRAMGEAARADAEERYDAGRNIRRTVELMLPHLRT
jgi:glycosyltransferase involved in cell wall biosynthesis